MVLADSHEISRVPHYSGTTSTPHATGPPTRLSRSTVSHPRLFNSQQHTVRPPGRRIQHGPTTPNTQQPPPLTRIWFSLLRFRSPLLTEYLLLRVLRCFTSPRSPNHPIHVQMMVTQHNPGEVPPFGHPRIITLARQLPEAYRRPQRPSSALDAKASTECPTKLNKTQKTVQNKYARNHSTNHKQPTTHTHTNNTTLLADYAGNHHNNGGRQHGVEREPDSVLICIKHLYPTQNAPTPTTHKQ